MDEPIAASRQLRIVTQELCDLIKATAAKPTPTYLYEVRAAFMDWITKMHESPRDVTSHSASEPLLYKEDTSLHTLYPVKVDGAVAPQLTDQAGTDKDGLDENDKDDDEFF